MSQINRKNIQLEKNLYDRFNAAGRAAGFNLSAGPHSERSLFLARLLDEWDKFIERKRRSIERRNA